MEIGKHFSTDLEGYLVLGVVPVGMTQEQAKEMFVQSYVNTSETIQRAAELDTRWKVRCST